MILAFDTYYIEDKAKAVAVAFNNWTDATPLEIYSEIIEGIAPYEPGSFYKREMPCVLSLLKTIPTEKVECIVVDGFVQLNDDGKPGLGAHLYEALEQKYPIIGVAKSGFHNNKKHVRELLRGESKKPLYISSIGFPLEEAYSYIQSMHGEFRMPTLLQLLDGETKSW